MTRYLRQIVTRGYETDARMCVSIGMFARYFEHVRWEGIRDPESGLTGIFADGGKLVIRAQAVRVARPVRPREDLTLSLSVAQVGRTSVHFVQLAQAADGLVARSDAIGVALDATGRPTPAPDALRARATGEPVERIPAIPDPPEALALRCSVQIRPSDLDALNHVNHSRYIDFVDDVHHHAVAAGAHRVARASRLASISVEYERETRLEALGPERKLEVGTWQVDDNAFAFELFDPLHGARVARALLTRD